MTCSSAVTWWDKSSMFCCRLCDSLDKTVSRGTGQFLLNHMSSWALPSPVTCDKQQSAENRLSSSATQKSYGFLSSNLYSLRQLCVFGYLEEMSFRPIPNDTRQAFLLIAERFGLKRMSSHCFASLCLLLYKCHCHILLHLSMSFPPVAPVSTFQVKQQCLFLKYFWKLL